MTHSLRRFVRQALVAGCLTALTIPLAANREPAVTDLDSLFAQYDREPDGPARDALAARIDAAAHQKYATVSRLYWHTDLEAAKTAARTQGRPILHLRMLGRLDEELSCANSRLFRATLYANRDVSRFLRERFVLYWSSERPVPRVTIDYGDGRKLERTTTGNSAHYILDASGHVLDVLPGVYAPAAFVRELEGSLSLAERVRATPNQRASLIANYHAGRILATSVDWQRIAPSMPGARRFATQPRTGSPLIAAQRATMSKSAMELRDLRVIARELAPEMVPDSEIATWAAAGRLLYGIGNRTGQPVLDGTSRALVARLHNDVPRELRATTSGLNATIAGLEQTLLADSALNQMRLRPRIAREIVRRQGRLDFATLNDWIYAEVFHTPKDDQWLGLLPRNVFTALPGDGVVIR
jgi:hypothetical protein